MSNLLYVGYIIKIIFIYILFIEKENRKFFNFLWDIFRNYELLILELII